jgi:hypothetical protein
MRGVEGVTDAEARVRLGPANCISWNVGHLAWQEQRYFLVYAGTEMLFADIQEAFAFRAPASTPPLAEMLEKWRIITTAADGFLESVDSSRLLEMAMSTAGKPITSFGNLLQRTIYHYWYHNGRIRRSTRSYDPRFVVTSMVPRHPRQLRVDRCGDLSSCSHRTAPPRWSGGNHSGSSSVLLVVVSA